MSRRRSRTADSATLAVAQAIGEMRSEYRMSRETRFQSRLKGVALDGSGADYHYRDEFRWLYMLERARSYDREDPVVSQGINRLCANILQEGFTLDVDTGDPGLDEALKTLWQNWSEDPEQVHSEREFDWSQIENLTLRHQIVDGDHFVLPLADGSLQLVEAHRCRTPSNTTQNVILGVQVDPRTKVRQSYWMTKDEVDPWRSVRRVSDVEKLPARDPAGRRSVLHLYDPKRTSQTRGVTALAPISEYVGIHDDLQFATLVKAQMAALIAILHERGAEWEPTINPAAKGPQETETEAGFTRTIEGMSAGLEVFGEKGEKLSAFSANIPNAEFFPHAMLVLTFIAVNLDLPVAVLLLDPSNTNFSGWRGAIDQARIRFKQIQRRHIKKLHTPVYRFKVAQWLADDPALRRAANRSGVNVLGHTWHPATWEYIEPHKDAQADVLQQQKCLNSPRRIQARRGREWSVISTEIVDDNALVIEKAIARAEKINASWPAARVDWREVLSLPTPDSISGKSEAPEPAQEAARGKTA